MDSRSRRSFLRLLAGSALALVAAPAILVERVAAAAARTIDKGPSGSAASLWAGRGCSATASALEAIGAAPHAPYAVDFGNSLAVVASGIDADALAVSGSMLASDSGSSWALVTLPRSLDQVALSVGGSLILAPTEGG